MLLTKQQGSEFKKSKLFYCNLKSLFTFKRQLALADVILLNKEDLVSTAELDELKSHIT